MYCSVYRFSSFNLLFYFGTMVPVWYGTIPDTYTLGSLQKVVTKNISEPHN